MRTIYILIVMLLSMDAGADFYRMGQLREAVKDMNYDVSSNYVRGATEMWLEIVRKRPEEDPITMAAARKCTSELTIETTQKCIKDAMVEAARKCINEFLSGLITWDMLDQNDEYPDELPVAIVINDVLNRCQFDELRK